MCQGISSHDHAGIGRPTEAEILKRVQSHLRAHQSNLTSASLWHGYIAALLEWGLIDAELHSRIGKLLPEIGAQELRDIFLGNETQPDR